MHTDSGPSALKIIAIIVGLLMIFLNKQLARLNLIYLNNGMRMGVTESYITGNIHYWRHYNGCIWYFYLYKLKEYPAD